MMSKPIVTRLFIGGGLAVIAGAILGIAAVWTAVATGTFVMNGPDIVGLRGSALAWSLLGAAAVQLPARAVPATRLPQREHPFSAIKLPAAGGNGIAVLPGAQLANEATR